MNIYELRITTGDLRRLALEGVPRSAPRGRPWDAPAAQRFYTPGNAEVPQATTVGEQYTSLLNALTTGLPTQISTQETYQPQLENLQLQGLDQELLGTPGTPGYLDLYTNSVLPALTTATAGANTAARASNVGDLSALGPGLTAALKGINPGTSALTDTLTKTANDQLKLGTMLDPASAYNISQGVRTSWADRGLGASNPAQLDEAMQLYGGGQTALAGRESAAGTAANLGYNLYTAPALDILGMGSTAPGAAASFTGTAAGAAGGSATGNDAILGQSSVDSLFNTVYNANAAQNISNSNNANAICGSAIGAGGSIGGGLLGNPGLFTS